MSFTEISKGPSIKDVRVMRVSMEKNAQNGKIKMVKNLRTIPYKIYKSLYGDF